jgi:hypothetical protein
MRYRIAFTKRVQSDGADSAMRPSAELDQNLSEGIVAEKVFIEELETEAQHSQEVLDEDDAFLGSAAPEVWEYEVVDARSREFEEALQNSDLVLEFDVVDSSVTSADEASTTALSDRGVYPPDGGNNGVDVTPSGSGVRAGDDGPAGMPTGDPSAGGLNRGSRSNGSGKAEVFEVFNDGGSDGIEDLTITDAGDPRLGLTNRADKPAQDWAANTGPTRNPDWTGAPDAMTARAAAKHPRSQKAKKRQTKT